MKNRNVRSRSGYTCEIRFRSGFVMTLWGQSLRASLDWLSFECEENPLLEIKIYKVGFFAHYWRPNPNSGWKLLCKHKSSQQKVS